MISRHLLICGVTLVLGGLVRAQEGRSLHRDRWVYVSRNLTKAEHVDDIRAIVTTAHEHGLNGMLLAGGLEGVGSWKQERLARLEAVKAICRENDIEIVPIIWSVGYGSGLSVDHNLAAGQPCAGVPFKVTGREARPVPDPDLTFVNKGFEQFDGDQMSGFRFHDKPGEVSFVDTSVFHGGKASLRFENFGAHSHGHARVMQEITVRPNRQYRVRCWVKSEDLAPVSAFKVQVYGPKSAIAPAQFSIPATGDWQEVSLAFHSRQYADVKIYAGLWGGQAGKLWLDDFSIEETPLVNVLRRPGTPVVVTSDDGQIIYEEGRDFETVTDGRFNLRHPRTDSPGVVLTADSRIRDGQLLRVSYYCGMAINRGQVSVCMSTPKLYEYWRDSAAALQKHLSPEKWFLSMDEIRAGGSCAACKARDLTMGQMLGDCISRQAKIIREVKPAAKVYIWSDMLDPNHNAHGDYYLVDGDYTGSWEHVPKDLVICCWYAKKREQSMRFFSCLGFETLAGAYYDTDNLDNVKGWLETVGRTPNCRGIMYTTWRNKYDLLPAFGELIRKPGPTR